VSQEGPKRSQRSSSNGDAAFGNGPDEKLWYVIEEVFALLHDAIHDNFDNGGRACTVPDERTTQWNLSEGNLQGTKRKYDDKGNFCSHLDLNAPKDQASEESTSPVRNNDHNCNEVANFQNERVVPAASF
jgi:hypothetical protein